SIRNTSFKDCKFVESKMNNAFLNLGVGNKSGEFVDCLFYRCDLTDSSFGFPIINNCDFNECILFRTAFNGSRLSNVNFRGVLDSCFFDGYDVYHSNFISLNRYSRTKQKNKMLEVDFNEATLKGGSFRYGISLEHCLFPNGPLYIFIKNPK